MLCSNCAKTFYVYSKQCNSPDTDLTWLCEWKKNDILMLLDMFENVSCHISFVLTSSHRLLEAIQTFTLQENTFSFKTKVKKRCGPVRAFKLVSCYNVEVITRFSARHLFSCRKLPSRIMVLFILLKVCWQVWQTCKWLVEWEEVW